jgi:hypothetical protein
MKKLHYILLALLIVSANSFAQDFQYHIHERYYNHYDTLRLANYGDLHVYLQGPMIEEAINKNLISNTKKCEAGVDSKYIFSIEPQVFYNPSMTTLHGELKIKIFTSQDMLKDSQLIKVQHQGRISIQLANSHINKIYDALLIKLENEILDKLPKDNSIINGSFCTIIEFGRPKNNLKEDYKKPIQA